MAEEKKVTEKKTVKRKRKAKAVEPVEKAVATQEVTEEKEIKAEKVNDDLSDLKLQNELLRQQLEQLKEQVSKAPQIIQVANDTELIDFLWIAPVADDNEFLIGGGAYGKITGKVGNFSIPKSNLSQILDSTTRKFIENRWLIVLSGLTDNERVMYGVDYKPGEYMDREVFLRMLDLKDGIVDIYKDLCDASKEIVAKMYFEAWTDPVKKHKVRRETVVALNKLSSQKGLKAILDDMNREESDAS